jgi:Biotin-lipoyl like
VQANQLLKAGDVLFKIDPTPYQSQLDALAAQLKFEEFRLSQMTQLQSTDSGRAFDVQQRQADVDKLKEAGRRREVESRKDCRARSLGWLCNQCRAAEGRERGEPAALAGDGIHQHGGNGRRRPNPADLYALYRARPGGRGNLQVLPRPGLHWQGRLLAGGDSDRPGLDLRHGRGGQAGHRCPLRRAVKLDDAKLAALPAGTAGDAAIYTQHIKPAHVIRKVILRQIAILNYVNPF